MDTWSLFCTPSRVQEVFSCRTVSSLAQGLHEAQTGRVSEEENQQGRKGARPPEATAVEEPAAQPRRPEPTAVGRSVQVTSSLVETQCPAVETAPPAGGNQEGPGSGQGRHGQLPLTCHVTQQRQHPPAPQSHAAPCHSAPGTCERWGATESKNME